MSREKIEILSKFALSDLSGNLLTWWKNHSVNEADGGFHGRVYGDNTPDLNAEKHIVLFARLLWTFSAAYRVLGNTDYLDLAERAYKYLAGHFYDSENGGFFTALESGGKPVHDYKMTYGNAFAVYALSEYARAGGAQADTAIQYAAETVDKLDRFVYDCEYRGYFETASRDWRITPDIKGVNRSAGEIKTMNTHLHLIEAYTALLRVRRTKRLQSSVREQLYIFLNKILNRDTWHFHYFQDRVWSPTTNEISFGHDIEGSWLLMESAAVLGEPEAFRAARDACVNIARAVYDQGIDQQSGGLLSEYNPSTRHYTERFSWWEQNESTVGFLNAWQLTGEEKFLDAALATVRFIESTFIDRENGGWYAFAASNGAPKKNSPKAADFVCPYHNARMSLEIIERAKKIHSSNSPAN